MGIKTMLIWALRRGQTKAALAQVADTRSRLEKFNEDWQDAITNVPFYAEWKMKHGLPDRITDLKELANWPILEKKDLIFNRDKLTRKGITKFHESVTGGATGEPLHFRTMPGDELPGNTNLWIGRARMGIYPDSKMFLLWGHRHFYGRGWKSEMRFMVRRLRDCVANHLRADATDLSSTALHKDYARMCHYRPQCIVAYSASLLCLVRTIRCGKSQCDDYRYQKPIPSLRAIVCTAGPLTKRERGEIEEFFGVPVGMEYGSMEGGVMAYLTPATDGRYRVFDTHLLQIVPEKISGNDQVLVTKLYGSYLPLIRYRLGDYISGADVDCDGFVWQFSEVYGRIGDEVDVGNGIRFHGQSFMTCAEGFSQIVAYQIRLNKAAGTVVFIAQTLSPLSNAEKDEIIKRAAHMSGLSPDSISVEEAKELVKAPSGKIRLVLVEG